MSLGFHPRYVIDKIIFKRNELATIKVEASLFKTRPNRLLCDLFSQSYSLNDLQFFIDYWYNYTLRCMLIFYIYIYKILSLVREYFQLVNSRLRNARWYREIMRMPGPTSLAFSRFARAGVKSTERGKGLSYVSVSAGEIADQRWTKKFPG